jgi:hypothetical protein
MDETADRKKYRMKCKHYGLYTGACYKVKKIVDGNFASVPCKGDCIRMRNYDNTIYHLFKKEKFNKYRFDVLDFAMTFDFCDNKEKRMIANVLDDAWHTYRPKKEEKKFDALKETKININGHE